MLWGDAIFGEVLDFFHELTDPIIHNGMISHENISSTVDYFVDLGFSFTFHPKSGSVHNVDLDGEKFNSQSVYERKDLEKLATVFNWIVTIYLKGNGFISDIDFKVVA